MATSPDYDGVKVDKWQISVETAPQQRDLPRQKIKVEIANIPAHTRELLPLRLNYDFLQGSGAVLVNAESIDEVMADKIVAFPVAKKYSLSRYLGFGLASTARREIRSCAGHTED